MAQTKVDSSLMDINLYDLFDTVQTASTSEIKTAYRKKALKCHPDKNPDNPKAAELFLQLSKALEILLDKAARDAYDKVLNAKEAAKIRHRQLDDKRKKFKEELEMREKAAQDASQRSKFNSTTPEQRLVAEIDRLRKEGSKQLQEEMEYIRKQINLEEETRLRGDSTLDPTQYRLKIKWQAEKMDEANGGYNSENLNSMFQKYGEISALIVSFKKKGSALIEFETAEAAIKAQQLEKGLSTNPLKVTWLNKEPPPLPDKKPLFSFVPQQTQKPPSNSRLFPSVAPVQVSAKSKNLSSDHNDTSETDFESMVLRKMKEAEERKRRSEEQED